nr:AAA-associated domain-containing protein [Burkholderia gladioli]
MGEDVLGDPARIHGADRAPTRRRLFREHVLRFVPLAGHIDEVLGERVGHRARFELEPEDHLDERGADRALRVVIDRGGYSVLFDYNDPTQSFRR